MESQDWYDAWRNIRRTISPPPDVPRPYSWASLSGGLGAVNLGAVNEYRFGLPPVRGHSLGIANIAMVHAGVLRTDMESIELLLSAFKNRYEMFVAGLAALDAVLVVPDPERLLDPHNILKSSLDDAALVQSEWEQIQLNLVQLREKYTLLVHQLVLIRTLLAEEKAEAEAEAEAELDSCCSLRKVMVVIGVLGGAMFTAVSVTKIALFLFMLKKFEGLLKQASDKFSKELLDWWSQFSLAAYIWKSTGGFLWQKIKSIFY